MSTAEMFGLVIFMIVLTLLFFAAFGGTNKRLMGQTEDKK